MFRCWWMLLLLVTAGSYASEAFAEKTRSARFGIEWVRRHRFTLMALTQRPGALADDGYVRAGFGTLLAWKRRPGLFEAAVRLRIPWHFHSGRNPLSDELKTQITELYKNYPGGAGLLVWDEPKRPELKQIGEVVRWAKKALPEVLVYSNAYPMGAPIGKYYGGKWIRSGVYEDPPVPYTYDDYLDDVIRLVGPDVLKFDIYPYKKPPEGIAAEYIAKYYFNNLTAVRRAALEAGIPYWVFVQAYSKEGGGGHRFPSESDLRMQIFSSLAFGFTGITYFTYDPAMERGLLDADHGSPNRLYYDATRVNTEVMNIGQALRFLASTDVRYIVGRHEENGKVVANPVPEGVEVYRPGSGDRAWLRDLTIDSERPGADGLVGFFRDDAGAHYMMLVNLRHGENVPAAKAKVSFRVTFAPSVKTVARLSRETGTPERIALRDGVLDMTLPGGTGDLFKIADDVFPGLSQAEREGRP